MPHLELSLRCAEPSLPQYENALTRAGALALTLLDAQAETADERAILEPAVGQTPLWNQLNLSALFDADTDALALLATLTATDPALDWNGVRFRSVDDQDWERAWLDQFQPMRFGRRLWIVPWNHALPEDAQTPEAAVLRLDPGLAFGSGTHPTTALCLNWLDALAGSGQLAGKSVLDVGCGSGILALAALKLGAHAAFGIDNDPQALTATGDNAQRNGLTVTVWPPEDAPAGSFPIVLANILASTLDALAESLAARVMPGGVLVLSGILAVQEHDLMTRYARWFERFELAQDGDWMRIVCVRNHAPT